MMPKSIYFASSFIRFVEHGVLNWGEEDRRLKVIETTVVTRLLEMGNIRKARKILHFDENQNFCPFNFTEFCHEDQIDDDEMSENFSTNESVTIYVRNFFWKTCG